MAWRPYWSCDLDNLYKLSFPLPKEAPYKILALIGQAVLERTFENVNGRAVAGPWLSYKLTGEPSETTECLNKMQEKQNEMQNNLNEMQKNLNVIKECQNEIQASVFKMQKKTK